MKELNYKQVMHRFSAAESNKQKWASYLEENYRWFSPDLSFYDKSAGNSNRRHIFDSTAEDSINDYANKMEQQLVPNSKHWVSLESGTDIEDDQKTGVDGLLEKTTEILFNHIESSNFSSQINECFHDLAISTGAIIIEPGDGIQSGLKFRAVPLRDLYLERSGLGIIETVFRRLQIPPTDFKTMFPQVLEDTYPDELKKELDIDKGICDIDLIEGIIYNDETRDYQSILIYEKSKDILFQETLESSPWVVFRENTSPGETYGRGRTMRCLNDVKTLNLATQFYMEAVELLANPIYTAVDDGLINPSTITIRPKSVIPVGSKDTINALPMSGNPNLNLDLMNRLQQSIRGIMLSKPFGNIHETPVRTATEMSMRNAEQAQSTSNASGRIQTELIERIIERCLYILKEQGKVPDIQANGKEVKVTITNPSARQQNEIEISNILRFMETTAAFPPELLQMSIKTENIIEFLAKKFSINSTLLRTESEKNEQAQSIQAREQAMTQPQIQG